MPIKGMVDASVPFFADVVYICANQVLRVLTP